MCVKVYSLIFCLFKHTCVCLCSFHLYCVISCSHNQTGAGLLSVVLFYQVWQKACQGSCVVYMFPVWYWICHKQSLSFCLLILKKSHSSHFSRIIECGIVHIYIYWDSWQQTVLLFFSVCACVEREVWIMVVALMFMSLLFDLFLLIFFSFFSFFFLFLLFFGFCFF